MHITNSRNSIKEIDNQLYYYTKIGDHVDWKKALNLINLCTRLFGTGEYLPTGAHSIVVVLCKLEAAIEAAS